MIKRPVRLHEEASSRWGRLFRDFHTELFHEKGPAVGGFFDNFGCGFAGAVTGFGFDSNESWFVATLRGLKCGGEFKTVRGHDPVVVIGGGDHCRGITATPPRRGDVMEW